MSRLTRDGTAEPVSRDQILRHAREQGNFIFPVQLTTSRIGNLTRLIHTLLYVMTIHTCNIFVSCQYGQRNIHAKGYWYYIRNGGQLLNQAQIVGRYKLTVKASHGSTRGGALHILLTYPECAFEEHELKEKKIVPYEWMRGKHWLISSSIAVFGIHSATASVFCISSPKGHRVRSEIPNDLGESVHLLHNSLRHSWVEL